MPQQSSRTVPAHRYRNTLWPVQRASKGWQSDVLYARYASALRQLLRTKRNTYLWAPDFGLNLEQFRTQGVNDVTEELIRVEIQMAVKRWIPDIQMVDLEVVASPGDETLTLRLLWGVLESLIQPFQDQSQSRFLFGPQWDEVSI